MKVELIAYTPNPDAVCNMAAGTCVSEDIPVMEMSVNRYRALKGALASGHESVAEHASFTFAISGVSRALTHQLVRHRTGASYSQQSQRYVNMDRFEWVMPKSIDYSDEMCRTKLICDPDTPFIRDAYIELMDEIQSLYEQFIEAGIPEEDARYILPNACTTNIVVTMNARQLMHFFKYRVCNRAQWEIRELAKQMLALCEEVAPTIFANAGANCDVLGYCPEARSCGKCPRLKTLLDKNSTI